MDDVVTLEVQKPEVNPLSSPEALRKLLTDEEIYEIQEISRVRDEQRWVIGNRMYDKIHNHDWPAMQTAVVYARLAGYINHRRVREFYYNSRFYQENPRLYVRYNAVANWDIFNFARKCIDPEAVLKSVADEGYTLTDLQQMFSAFTEDETTSEKSDKPKYERPIYVKPLLRWVKNHVKPELWPQVDSLIDALLGHLRELSSENGKDVTSEHEGNV